MRFLIILCAVFFVASLFDAGLAMSQTVCPSQPASATYQQAMDKCQELYAGYRGAFHQRYFNIEMCFKS
jgi:hypothetical protein